MDGFAFHGVRKPFTPMTEEGRKELRRVYEEIIIPNRQSEVKHNRKQ